MKKHSILLALLLASTACLSAQAQTEKKPLTNQDVMEMVKAGLAETVVLSAVQSKPGSYDTSATALIELQKAGVSAKVQEAMLAAQNPGNGTAAAGSAAGNGLASPQSLVVMGEFPSVNRVFLVNGSDRTELKQNKGEYKTVVAPFYSKVYIAFAGKLAECRLPANSPVFEVTLPGNWVASEHVRLVKLEVHKEQRELPVQGMAGPGIGIKPDKKLNQGLTFEEVKNPGSAGSQFVVQRVKTAKPLPPGEYVLALDHTFYCFGSDAAK